MRKILLTTSTLAGMAMVAGTAVAQAPTVTFSGSTDYYVRFSGDDFAANVNNGEAGPGWDINQHNVNSELSWDVNATADNGLQYGARIEFRYGDSATDEAWIDFAGAWGRVVLGDDDGVGDSTQIGAAGGRNGITVDPVAAWDTGRFNGAFNSTAGYTATTNYGMAAEGLGDNSKIAYYSPVFAGFSAAVSISPDSRSGMTADNADSVAAPATYAAGVANNVTEAALNYDGNFGGVAVQLHGAYQWAEADAGFGQTRADVGSYQLGAVVGYSGFALGMGYGDNDDSGCLSTTVNCDAGDWWNVGVGYNFGAGAIGVSYSESENNFDGGAASDKQEVFSVTATYTVAQGLTAYGGIGLAETTNGDAVANGSNDSTVFVLGTRVSF